MQIHVHLIIIPALLVLAAVFAAAEAALFSLSRTQLESLRVTRPHVYRRIVSLISKPEVLLSTVIVSSECLNIMIGTAIAGTLEFYFRDMSDRWLIALSVAVSSFLMLTISEILPKVLAFRLPVLLSTIFVYPLSWTQWLLTPMRRIFLWVSSKILAPFGIRASGPAPVSEKDFLTLVEVGAESGSLRRDEKEMIANVFHFSDMPVSNVMTPWNRVFCVKNDMDLEKILDAIKLHPFSRIPVISVEDNRVMGIVYTKEILKLILADENGQSQEALKNAVFPPYIVSSHKKVSKLFREFKLKKVHIALVVDEYGRNLGVVTLEDLLNALFRTQKRVEGANL